MNHLSIRIEGGLLSPDFLETINQAVGQKPPDFGLKPRDSLVDEVSAVWGDVLTYWQAFQRRKARSQESLTTITREQWLLPLLDALGYSLTFQRSAAELDGRTYPISHRTSTDESGLPVHLVAYDQALGDRPPSGRAVLSPHALMQDYLNRTDDNLWGIVSNGRILRLLRDSTYFTRPAYIEFDLETMLNGERLDEFFLLYRLAHRSRLPQPGQPPAACLLEQYHQAAIEQGGRIRDGLRQAVAEAILTFGNGFLRHPRNESLRQRLQNGELTAEAYYQQLLYLIYRLLFLMVAEERNLLEGEGGLPGYYRAYFSLARLRALADAPLSAPERFDDLYLGLRTLFVAFHDETLAAQLGVPALNGELFSSDNAPDLDAAFLNNRDLLYAIRLLSYFTPPDEKVRRRVNYAALDVEELGSVYESLLDEQPVVEGLQVAGGRLHVTPSFSFVSGTARKTTGSYYTPRELVNEVIKSALLPVIEARLKEAEEQRSRGEKEKNISSAPPPLIPSAQETALLSLRICDPACGSGHFLLAAARRIGYELAKVRANADEPAPEQVRAATREAITHCIYGVDKNPLAVDLCKVALWIEGHSRGKPLTFLDYRIRCGDSLVGVLDLAVLDEGIPDEAYTPVSGDDKTTAVGLKKQNKEERAGQTSLFDQLSEAAAPPAAADWQQLEAMPEDTPEQVNAKRERHRELLRHSERARTAANLWCAAFFSPLTPENLPHVPTTDVLRRYRRGQAVSGPVVGATNALAADREVRFFHWPLEFPQVFAPAVDPKGFENPSGLAGAGGFDVVLGNPPWERIKLQEQEFFASRDPAIATAANKAAREKLIKQLPQTNPLLASAFAQARHAADAASKFLRGSGRFPLTARGDINTYTVFTELSRNVTAPLGRAGIIVPTGIATDRTTSDFFSDLVQSQSLAQLIGFENEAFIFAEVHHSYKFCVLSMTGRDLPVAEADFIFFARYFSELQDRQRHFTLSTADFAAINPNTLNCPIFRTKMDAELTKKIYRRVPVLINEKTGSNPWGVSFMRMFDMSNDSNLFANEPLPEHLPLYEAKMIWHFDHRYSTYEGATQAQLNVGSLPKLDEAAHQDPYRQVRPRYWVHQSEVAAKLTDWPRHWLIGFRDVTSAVVERTAIFSLIPPVGVGNSAPLLFPQSSTAVQTVCLLACLDSITFDFVTRQKIAGVHMNFFFLAQLPVLVPETYGSNQFYYIVPRVLELVYTAWDIAPFTNDIWQEADEPLRHTLRAQWEANWQATGGHEWTVNSEQWAVSGEQKPPFPPFKWDDERRARLRAELDAFYARLYGLSRDELRYILDPADIYGPDFPGETFRVLKEKEIKAYGEYRTQRLVLAAWDAQQAAIDRGELHFDLPPLHDNAETQRRREEPEASAPPAPTPATVREPAPTLELRLPPGRPAPKPPPASKPATNPALDPRLLLPDISLATKGSYSQRLKRAQALVADTSDKATAELVIFLAAPESGIQWLAQTALEKRGGAMTVTLLRVLIEKSNDEGTWERAQAVLKKLA